MYKSDTRVAEILETFETIDHYMKLARSERQEPESASKKGRPTAEHERITKKGTLLGEQQLTMSYQTNTESDDEPHEDLMMVDQLDKAASDSRRQ